MGACGSSATPEQKAALKASQELDKKNAGEWAKDNQKIKLLLLGAGESGKSTIFKQVSFVHFLARSWRARPPPQEANTVWDAVGPFGVGRVVRGGGVEEASLTVLRLPLPLQMKVLFGQGFLDEERRDWLPKVTTRPPPARPRVGPLARRDTCANGVADRCGRAIVIVPGRCRPSLARGCRCRAVLS